MRKILIVDDELNILSVLEKFFKLNGFEVTRSDNCQEAMEYINSADNIDIVIVDLKIAGFSGIDILKHIGSLGKKIPAVILSGCSQLAEEDLEALRNLGYSETDVYCKPMDLFALLEVVNNKLSLKN